MVIATSKVTAQGQISVPAEVRKRLAIRPGTQLIWSLSENGDMVIKPKKYSLEDTQKILADGPDIRLDDNELQEARTSSWLAHHHRNATEADPS